MTSPDPFNIPCPRCGEKNKLQMMQTFGTLTTEWGGKITAYGCSKCGMCALEVQGKRPDEY